MTLRSLAALGSLMVAAHSPASAQVPSSIDSVSRYVIAEMRRQQIPGVSIAILRADRVLLARGYGFANLELRVPAADSTIYQSGSVGKQFTAAGVAMLAELGRLSLDDRITRWLSEGRGIWDSITVRHLLTHTSGITEYTDSTFDYRKDYSEDQLVGFAASRPLDFRPGDRWSYSNTGYLLLGVLIHRTTGRFYGEVLRDLIFSPLGMRSTRIISEADVIANRSAGYQVVDGRIKNQDWVSPSLNTTADGALYFSVNDLVQWARALNHRRIPSARVLDSAWIPVRLNDGGRYPYGFGWDLSEQRGHHRVGHTGSWQGFKSAIYRYPPFDLTVVVLANLAQAESGAIAQGIAGLIEPALRPAHLLPNPLRGPSPPLAIPELLARMGQGSDSGTVAPGLRRFLTPADRRELKQTLGEVRSWIFLGCDEVAARRINWLGGDVKHICYARSDGSPQHMVVSVFYTADWQATHYELQPY